MILLVLFKSTFKKGGAKSFFYEILQSNEKVQENINNIF
jgi:hypothetical protein